MTTNTISRRAVLGSAVAFYLGLCLWLGGLALFGYGVAPVIFKTLPSKDMAGALNAVILQRLNLLEFVGAFFVGVGLCGFVAFSSSRRAALRLASVSFLLWTLMTALLGVYALGLSPDMNALRARVSSFDKPDKPSLALVEEFRSYHRWYSRLVTANIVLGLALLVVQTRVYIALSHASER
jgi:hypothetical protein